ncbi:zf-HC2 domain-containing protein [Paenibacillus sp. MMS20-IR301]|uniref:zf-HC2 domain-containing protein n=1 Tax=Paenibacillus sp. MMS20-IR301 TaxID=2895946 RepID=UPI0028EA6CA4|nr:zf-HC2 domain-containing protein [Paenibacillus sp. MMS20-IR301]WNS45554.1 zf-HC2 domain-containing protein [Paenibacillus sp. MMS20-IR301]
MNKLSCEVVEDLLPLYHDEVCSAATKEAVGAHLATCSRCSSALRKLQQSSSLPFERIARNKEEVAGLSSFQGYFHRSRVLSFVKGLLLATAVCAVLILGYAGLFRWNITEVPSSAIDITEVSLLQNGKIAYHVKVTDGYEVNQINGKMENDGIFYITPVRPVFKSRKFAELGLGNRYDTIDLEILNANRTDPSTRIKAVYYGPKDDNPILIWKQGMALPPATPTVEAQFTEQH